MVILGDFNYKLSCSQNCVAAQLSFRIAVVFRLQNLKSFQYPEQRWRQSSNSIKLSKRDSTLILSSQMVPFHLIWYSSNDLQLQRRLDSIGRIRLPFSEKDIVGIIINNSFVKNVAARRLKKHQSFWFITMYWKISLISKG